MTLIVQGKTNLKYILIVVIFAIFAGGGILTYQYWWLPKQETPPIAPDETAGRQTYRNDEYGFELKYPMDWSHLSDVMSEWFSKKFVKDSNTFVCRFGVATIENFDNYMKEAAYLNSEMTNITINDIPAIKIKLSASAQSQGQYGTYLIKREDGGKFSFEISTSINKLNGQTYYGTVNDANCLNIFDQILSTFKFIPSSEAAKITVLSPNGGETWEIGKSYTISWKTTGLSSDPKVSILLEGVGTADNSGEAYQLIETVNNTGSYTWTIPADIFGTPNNTYKILIYKDTNSDIQDRSNAPFSITAATTPGCTMKWWFDSSTTVCSQKQFCGAFMYYGLQTFDTQADCQAHLP